MTSLDELVERAAREQPDVAAEVDMVAFRAHIGTNPIDVETAPSTLHAGDMLLAFAAAKGHPRAISAIEEEHLSRVRELAASIEKTPERLDDLRQALRERLFVGEDGRGPRLLGYSGRGSLGAWIRVMTTRLALDNARTRKVDVLGGRRSGDDDEATDVAAVDPELGYLKDLYGDLVSDALREALGSLDSESRALLAMHYVDGVSIDRLGVMLGVSRATAARRLASVRGDLIDKVQTSIAGELSTTPGETESLLVLVRSRLDFSLSRILRS